MQKIIYLKYGELTLKGKNRSDFSNRLLKNIKYALSEFTCKFIKSFDNILIEMNNEKDLDAIVDILKRIPGIFQIIVAYVINSRDINEVGTQILDIVHTNVWTTFKVETKRHDKSYPINSMDFSKQMGGIILQNTQNKKVVMNHPDLLINIEIRDKNTICYFDKTQGVGGLPVGSSGRCLMLISGGIDSPVAASLLMKRGMHVDFLTFITPPHTADELVNKIKTLINKVTLDGKLEKPRFYVCNFTHIQHELAHISDHSYQITLMRRYFYRIADSMRKKEHYDAIGTGESLGQVASQTIESLATISSVLSDDCVVLRPLLTYDKLETIKIAKAIDTYETSIIPLADCCSLFVPANPVTRPNKETAQKLEQESDLLEEIYQQTIKSNIKIIY